MKRYIKIYITVLFCFFLSKYVRAQELNCTVSIVSPQIQQTPTIKSTLTTLQNSIREFMNTRSWTGELYQANEKIECQILITISSYDVPNNQFSGTIQVSSSRPIYGSTYSVGLLNVLDKGFSFKYIEFQPLDYIEGTYSNDLTSVLGFYAYVIIGVDYDSYIDNGGTAFLAKASSIVNSAQTSNIIGWKSGEKVTNNRYNLIYELTDENKGKAFRHAMYTYHRMGFDMLAEDVEKGRETMAGSLAGLEEIYKNNPFSYLLQIFFFTKKDELIAAFSQATTSQKTKVSALCQEMDPGNATKYAEKLRP
jgi:hypothetical protein